MNKYILLMMIMIMGIFSCKEKFSGDNRGNFSWTGWYEWDWVTVTVSCDKSCSSCYDDLGSLIKYSSYKQVYEYCRNIPVYTAPTREQTDPKNTDTKPTGTLQIRAASTTVYGFDSWRDAGVTNNKDKINYVSVAAGCSTFVSVSVTPDLFDAYETIVAKLPKNCGVSFEENVITDSLILTNPETVIPIYASKSATLNTPISMDILCIEDPMQPVTFVGNSYSAVDKLSIVVYEEQTYSSENCVVYLVNSPSFNPDSAAWSNNFNKIIKQGVINMNGMRVERIDNSSWDLNRNGALDDFASYDSVPFEYYERHEYFKLLEVLKQYDEGCDINKYSATIVLEKPIRSHYLLLEDVSPGSSLLPLNTVKNLKVGEKYHLGPWLGGVGSDFEMVKITSVDTNINCITVEGIQYNHYANESIGVDGNVSGFAFNSCSCVGGQTDYKVYIHEFLHQEIVGGFGDVDMDNNIMNYHYPVGDLMRYRTINSFNKGDQSQWSQLTREQKNE